MLVLTGENYKTRNIPTPSSDSKSSREPAEVSRKSVNFRSKTNLPDMTFCTIIMFSIANI
jgi:hypothetical protein